MYLAIALIDKFGKFDEPGLNFDGIDKWCKDITIPEADETDSLITDVLWASVPETKQIIPIAFFFNVSKHALSLRNQISMYVVMKRILLLE